MIRELGLFFACELFACAAPNVEHGVVNVDGGSLYYESAGDGAAVVLLHGGATDRRLWDRQFQSWAEEFRVVRYDERGFGKSISSKTPYGGHDDLGGLLDHLELQRATLVGLSLGGRIALDYAIEHPERVDALVLVGAGISGFDWSAGSVDFGLIDEAVRAGDGELAAERWLETDYMAPVMRNPATAPFVRRLTMENAASWLRTRVERELDPPAIARLHEVRVPVLVVVGERDVPEIKRIARHIATGVARSSEIILPGAGHLPNLEAPDRFELTVRPFLSEHANDG